MRLLHFYLVIFSLEILVGCASSNYVNPDYTYGKFSGRTLLYMPLGHIKMDTVVNNAFQDDFKDSSAILQNPDSLLSSLIYDQLKKQYIPQLTISKFSTVDTDSLDLVKSSFNDTEIYYHPTDKYLINNGISPDLVLYFYKPDIEHYFYYRYPSGGGMAMQLSVNYIMWDYKSNVPVMYGKLSGMAGMGAWVPYFRKLEWEKLSENTISNLMSYSPFNGPEFQNTTQYVMPK